MNRVTAIALLLAAAVADQAFACAPAPRAGEGIAVVEESAVIVWDPATKTQHFIRRAMFQGDAKDFGFLVPTPTAPLLAAVDDSIFDMLVEKTRPKTIEKTRSEIDWTPLVLLPLSSKGEMETAAAQVEVLSTHKVAGYEAVVLDATDANALRDWLAKNGYAVTDGLAAWLDVYVQKRWMITAFKIDKSADSVARTSAVKMSFLTDRPFFPYREPATTASDVARALRVFVVAPERVVGRIGEAGHWAGVLRWSDRLDDELRGEIGRIASIAVPHGARLSAFVDQTVVRDDDDLYFARSALQTPHLPPPNVIEHVRTTYLPADLLVFSILVVAYAFRRLLKR